MTDYIINYFGKPGRLTEDEEYAVFHIYKDKRVEPFDYAFSNPRTGKPLKLFCSGDFPLKPGQIISKDQLRTAIPRNIARLRIDREIRPAVMALNEAGLITLECCAGHPEKDYERGYIVFLDELDRGTLRPHLRRLWLKNFRIITSPGDETVVTFNRLSKTKSRGL
jgi:hypothetical protein